MEKIINISNDKKIIVSEEENYYGLLTKIAKYYYFDEELIKYITLSSLNSFEFDAKLFCENNIMINLNEIEYIFDEYDPLYRCFLLLLNNSNQMIIKDDIEKNKYLIIEKNNGNIKIIFHSESNSDIDNKFYINTIDIGEAQKRMKEFFIIVKNRLLYNEYHCHKKTLKK